MNCRKSVTTSCIWSFSVFQYIWQKAGGIWCWQLHLPDSGKTLITYAQLNARSLLSWC